MLTCWRLTTTKGPALIYRRGATPPDSGRETAPQEARWLFATWSRDAAHLRQLTQLCTRLGMLPPGGARHADPRSTAALLNRLGEAFTRGDLVLRVDEYSALRSVPEPERAADTDADAPATKPDPHWVDFTFVYPDGSPAGGYDYQLTHPDGAREPGALPASGVIHREDVPVGLYTVQLKDVASVHWEQRAVRCGEDATVTSLVRGFAEGTAARVRIFREHQEDDAQALATLAATVAGDRVECTWRYDYTADDARKAERGVARFVAEVSLAGGKYWNKTARRALAVQLKSLVSVRWTHAAVAPGGAAEVEVVARGYAPGTSVALELWGYHPALGQRKLADLAPALIAGDTARARVRFAPADDATAPAFASGAIQHSGEYFVRATIDDDVHRAARSNLLVCDGLATAQSA